MELSTVVSNPSTRRNVDDYYSPEVNSNLIALPGIKTATGLDCSKVPNNNGVLGGYQDAAGKPTPAMPSEIRSARPKTTFPCCG